MEQSLIQWVVGQTGLAGIAALALWIMRLWHEESAKRRDEAHQRELQRQKEFAEREKANADEHRSDKHLLITALNANTASITQLVETFRNAQVGTMAAKGGSD